MTDISECPQCTSINRYEYAGQIICPECGYECAVGADAEDAALAQRVAVVDAHGTPLHDGDTVVVIKGSSSVVKIGTKVKNIRLTDGDHDIDCKIPGFGAMGLKSEFVKKSG